MEQKQVKRKLLAILSADVKSYTSLMQDDEQATVETLSRYKAIMADLILQHHGRVVDSPGDNLLAEFASVVDAAQGAVAIQRELKSRNDALPPRRRMEFRMGINLGDVIVEGDNLYGDGVNLAARLEGLSDPGGICISRTAFDQIEDKLPLGYEYMGEQQVKNVDKPVRAYKVLLWPEDAPEASSRPRRQRPDGFSRHRRKTGHRPHRSPKERFRTHLRAYLGTTVFLAVINLLTYSASGVIWFHWPALGWGLALYFHGLKAFRG